MIYPKQPDYRSNTNSQRINQNNKLNPEINKIALVSKIAKALKIKHMNHFLSVGYDEKDLLNDINSHLTIDNITKPPAEVFNLIEKGILSITKQRPRIRQYNTANNTKGLKSITDQQILSKQLNIKEGNSSLNAINTNIKANDNGSPLQYRDERHELVDKLRKKMEHSDQREKPCETAPSQIKRELKEKKQKEQEEMAFYLQMQIKEKESQRQQLKNEDKEYITNHLKQMQWNEKEAMLERKKRMQHEFKYSLDTVLKERKKYEASVNNQRKQLESNILSANRLSLEMDKEKQIEKDKIKKQLYQDQLNERNEYSEMKKMKEKIQLQLDKEYLAQYDEVIREREIKNEEAKSKLIQHYQSKDKDQLSLPKYSKKLPPKYNQQDHQKANNDTYIKEREESLRKTDEEKQVEQRKKSDMVNEMKKGLDEMLRVKEDKKNISKKMDNEYNDYMMNNYQLYLNEEEKKKENQRNQVKKYKEELDNQIKDKKRRNDSLN